MSEPPLAQNWQQTRGPVAEHAEQGLVPPRRPAWCSALSDKLLAILFVIFLVTPGVAWLLGRKGMELHENRTLAPPPDLSSPVATWPPKLEAYYNDRFGFRSDLVRLNSLLLHKYLKVSNADAVVGKDGWLFYAREDIFKDFFGKGLFTQEELERWKEYLENRRALLAKRSCRYLFVVVPDKDTIYPEKLPSYIRQHRGKSRLQQLKEYLRQSGSPVEILDLHETLLAAKKQGVLYFPQDTHWNGRGFFVGYHRLCAALATWFPGIRPQKLGVDYGIRTISSPDGDWNVFGLIEENWKYRSDYLVPLGTQRARKGVAPFPKDLAPIPQPWLAPLEWDGPGAHNLLVIHDSYMRTGALDSSQVPLAEHFARTMLVGMRPTDYEVNLIAKGFEPDVVIEERAERIMGQVPAPSFAGMLTVDAKISGGSRFTVYVNNQWTMPMTVPVVPNQWHTYHFGVPNEVTMLRLDPSELGNAEAQVRHIRFEWPGKATQVLKLEDIPSWVKYNSKASYDSSSKTTVITGLGQAPGLFIMGTLRPSNLQPE